MTLAGIGKSAGSDLPIRTGRLFRIERLCGVVTLAGIDKSPSERLTTTTLHQAEIFSITDIAISNTAFLNRSFKAAMSISVVSILFCRARTANAANAQS